MAVGIFIACGCSTGQGDAPAAGAAARPASSPTSAIKVLRLKQVDVALPGPEDVPDGWVAAGTPRRGGTAQDDGRIAYGTSGYQAPDLDGAVGFTISSYTSTADAIDHFAFSKTQYKGGVDPITMTGADQAFAAQGCVMENACSATIIAQSGPVVLSVNINTKTHDYRAPDPRILNSAARMQIERVRQTQHGKPPTAQAS
ncbi:hypothetical protein ACFWDI_27545 [Streptomyces sp. NPDC060064]|uniref:hypothetical protein n=1 Tax=Streptomyces sp. NPDC060064 TaxID=3347049 RepID=UPI0036C59A0A